MKQKALISIIAISVIVTLLVIFLFRKPNSHNTLKVGISPYQDIAMIVNARPLGLEKKYGTTLDLQTMDWEKILPALSSKGESIDVGFGSLIEYLTKSNKINAGSDDPLLFIYPAYIFKGGGFITFDNSIPAITRRSIHDTGLIRRFLSKKIGVQKNSVYEMLLFSLSRTVDLSYSGENIMDITLDNAILATRKGGSLDIAAAGLTQITEAQKQGGRVLLTMEEMGFADVTGFVCRKSVLDQRRSDIEHMIRMWYDCVDYVLSDIDRNSVNSLKYLEQNAATKYTLAQYKQALSQEYFPRSLAEVQSQIIAPDGKYSYLRIVSNVSDYLLTTPSTGVTERPLQPVFIQFSE